MADTLPTRVQNGTPALYQRTEAGALLRSGLDALAAIPLPPGKKGQIAVVTDMENVELGVAWRRANGWEIQGNVSAAIKNGRKVKAAVSVSW